MKDILGSNPLLQTLMNNGVPLNQQVTPSSTNFQPDMQALPFGQMPNKKVMSAAGPMAPPPVPGVPNMPNPLKPVSMSKPKPLAGMAPAGSENEVQSIIRILGERAMALTRMEEKAHGQQLKTKPSA